MKKVILDNGLKLIYEKINSGITSFTIGFEAGADRERPEEMGLAHVTEHMIFKGTDKYSEREINDLFNKYFGFHNAMTNYPYAVYYASALKEDFKEGFQLYVDLVFNPALSGSGFEEEISVILEELKEWSDDPVQHCEDRLFYNSFKTRRIKNLIIGDREAIRGFTIEDVKRFHKEHYKPSNCVISVVTSLELDEVISTINKAFPDMKRGDCEEYPRVEITCEDICEGIYEEELPSINGCKVQYIFPIHQLNKREVSMLYMFNEYFASGTSSILYDEIRTRRGLVYDIMGRIKAEKGIQLYSITFSTSKENLNEVMSLIDNCIEDVKSDMNIFDEQFFAKYLKSQRTKRILALEKSIVMAMQLSVYELMYKDCNRLLEEFDYRDDYSSENMKKMVEKLFKHRSIQIIKSAN